MTDMLKKITEGMTGQEAANTVYSNDAQINAVTAAVPAFKNPIRGVAFSPGALQVTGEVTPDVNYQTTGFIPVEAFNMYCTSPVRISAQYNKNKQMLSGTHSLFENVSIQFTTRPDTGYVRFTILNDYDKSFSIIKGVALQTDTTLSGAPIETEPNPLSIKRAVETVLNDYDAPKNILEGYTSLIKGRFLEGSQEVVTSSDYVLTDYIGIAPDTLYSINFYNETANYSTICLYGENKVALPGQSYSVKSGNRGNRFIVFTTPTNAKYARISSAFSTWKYVQLCEGVGYKMDNSRSLMAEYTPDFEAVQKNVRQDLAVSGSLNILSPDLFKFAGVVAAQNLTRTDSYWIATDYIPLDPLRSGVSHENCRFVAYFDGDKKFIAVSDNPTRGYWQNTFYSGALTYFGDNPTRKRPRYVRITARLNEVKYARMWYGKQAKTIEKDASGNPIYALPSPEKPPFKDSLRNILNVADASYAAGTFDNTGETITEGSAATLWRSSGLIDVSNYGRHLYLKKVRIFAEYDESMKFIAQSYRMIGDVTGNGYLDLELLPQTRYIRITVRLTNQYSAFIADAPLINRVESLSQGDVTTYFNPDPEKVRDIAGGGSVDPQQVEQIVDRKLDSYDFGQLVNEEVLDEIVTDELISEVAAQLECNVTDNRAPQSGYELFADNKDFKIWKPVGTPIQALKGNWAVRYIRNTTSFQITGGGINGTYQAVTLDTATFPNLIPGSVIWFVLLVGFDPSNANPEAGGINLESDVRCCVITNKGQIYHNKPNKAGGVYGSPTQFDESVVWDIYGRRLPSKTVDNDIYYLNPCLPDAAYEIRPGIKADNGYGNGGFPIQKTVGGIKYNRFYQHARAEQNIPFWFMGGFAQNHKLIVLGTYRSNKGADPASRICLFASCDGGRQWHNIQEYASDDSDNYGMVFNSRGNRLQPNGITNNYSSGSLEVYRVELNIPSSTIKEPATKFKLGAKLNVSGVSTPGANLVLTTATPHGLSTGNRIVVKKGSGWKASSFDFLTNDAMTANSGGNLLTLRVVVLSPTQLELYEYIHGANTNIPCRHIHAINGSKTNFVVSCGEVYPQGWVSLLKVETSDTWYPIGSLYNLPYIRLTSSQDAIQRALGTLVIDDGIQSVIYASDDATIARNAIQLPGGRTVTESFNSTGIYRGRLSEVDNINKFEVIYPAQQVAYLFQDNCGLWVFCGQQGELAVSVDKGRSWRTYGIGIVPLEHPGWKSNNGIVTYDGWLFYKK